MVKKAAESRLVRTARKKLEKRLDQEKKSFSPEGLARVRAVLRATIVRQHDPDFLEKRTFALFDENTHSAKTKSKAIQKLSALLSPKTGSPRR